MTGKHQVPTGMRDGERSSYWRSAELMTEKHQVPTGKKKDRLLAGVARLVTRGHVLTQLRDLLRGAVASEINRLP